MKETKRLSVQEEIRKEAERIEKEIAGCPELKDLTVSEELEAALLEKIRAYEKEKAERAGAVGEGRDMEFSGELVPEISDVGEKLRGSALSGAIAVGKDAAKIGAGDTKSEGSREGTEKLSSVSGEAGEKVVLYRRKRKALPLLALVAVLILVLGLSITSVGSKSYMKVFLERLQGKEPMSLINVEDMNDKESEDINELAVYREIDDTFDISVPRMKYKPKEMFLTGYTIDEDLQQAKLFYKYEDQVIRYIIYINDKDSSVSEKKEDVEVGEYSILINGVEIKIEELEIKNSKLYRQVANFKYKGVRYQLNGIMEKEEFKKVLKNLYIFKK